jgi:K+-sensing histidine kinase KdpD
LIENSIKHNKKKVCITIKAWAENDDFKLLVNDDGKGIDSKRVFQNYYEVSSKDSRDKLGLGLPLVRMIVELHGGRLAVVSQNSGCGLEVTLPRNGQV